MTDFERTRELFHLPEGVVYLDGNSLGPLPLAAKERVARLMTDEWGELLIKGWNKAGWMMMPRRIGDRVGRLIGAAEGTVVMGDTLSIKVYQALASAVELVPDRKVILSDSGNFPSDLYMAQGLISSFARGHELRIVDPEEVEAALDESVAVLMLTEVDYRTGRLHDMKALTKKAHDVGAVAIWDLAHSAARFRSILRVRMRTSPLAAPINISTAARRTGLHLCGAPACRQGQARALRLARP